MIFIRLIYKTREQVILTEDVSAELDASGDDIEHKEPPMPQVRINILSH
jgi:hypothetical protein